MSYLAPFAGIVPTIRSPLQFVALFTPFTDLNSLPAIVLGTSMAVLPWPLHLLYHVCISGFRSYVWFPPRHPLDFASYSPFEYLHRLHYDSMIGPALVYPRVPHEPWTYEPHAHGRTLSSVFFSPLVLVSLLSSILVFYFFYICLGVSFAFVLGSCIFLQHWY